MTLSFSASKNKIFEIYEIHFLSEILDGDREYKYLLNRVC